MSTAPDSRTTQAGGSGAGLRLTSWDVGYFASALVVLAGSLVPLITVRWGVNLWGVYNLFFIGIGILLPLTAAGFLMARAASGASSRQMREAGPRLGSLSTEQFAHVAAWLALAFYFITFATTLDPVLLIGLAGGLGLVVTSPLRGLVAPLITGAAGSAGSAGSAAARAGEPAQEPVDSPVHDAVSTHGSLTTPAPALDAGEVQEPSGADSGADSGTEDTTGAEAENFPSPTYGQTTAPPSPEYWTPSENAGLDDLPEDGQDTQDASSSAFPADAGTPEDLDADSPSAATPAAPRGTESAEYEAFWFAVGTRRPAVDPEGAPVFELEPGGWILALEDRGQEYLVQNTDGRTGMLRDLTDIERA